MKRFVCILIIFSILNCSVQEKQLRSKKLNAFISNLRVDQIKTFDLKYYNVSSFIYSNKSGSAHIPEADEVTDNLIFSICKIDENSFCKNYEIKNVFAPIIGVATEDKRKIYIKWSFIPIRKSIHYRRVYKETEILKF